MQVGTAPRSNPLPFHLPFWQKKDLFRIPSVSGGSRGGDWGPCPPLLLDQTEKQFWETAPHQHLFLYFFLIFYKDPTYTHEYAPIRTILSLYCQVWRLLILFLPLHRILSVTHYLFDSGSYAYHAWSMESCHTRAGGPWVKSFWRSGHPLS